MLAMLRRLAKQTVVGRQAASEKGARDFKLQVWPSKALFEGRVTAVPACYIDKLLNRSMRLLIAVRKAGKLDKIR